MVDYFCFVLPTIPLGVISAYFLICRSTIALLKSYHPYLVSICLAVLLQLHLVTFLFYSWSWEMPGGHDIICVSTAQLPRKAWLPRSMPCSGATM